MKVGIIGIGYWGPNLIRNFMSHPDVEEVVACDSNPSRLKFVKNKFPGVRTESDLNTLLDNKVDIVAVATPVDSHFEIVKKALQKGKHVWVEKPFTSKSSHAQELIEIASRNGLNIFVDHTFIYTGAVRKIKELVDKRELGDVIYFDSVRINLGLFQHDVNVIWDLATHDLSIMNYVLPEMKVKAISANGLANYYNQENIAHLSVYFESNCFAHFHVNWTSPVKIRRMIVGGREKMLVFDDLLTTEKIKVYDSSVEVNHPEKIHELLVQYRSGDMYSPRVDNTEALALGVKEFIDSINEKRKPLTSGEDGLNVVKILEAADISIKKKGELVEL